MTDKKTNEVEMITRLIWKLAAAFGIVLVLMVTTMGGGFLFLAGADAQQNTVIGGKIGNIQFAQMFAQAQTSNRDAHDIILGAVASNTEKTEENSVEIVKVGKDVSKILGILKMLVGNRDDNNGNPNDPH